jgi:simple sugar transport system permease protein
MSWLRELFTLRGTVGRSRYLAVGLGLALLKYAVDAGCYFAWTGKFWGPTTYLDPNFGKRMEEVDHLPTGYLAFLVVVPAAWWVLGKTPLGLSIRAAGENPEAADVAGINVFRIRYIALMIGGAFMAVGGAFITLAMLGTFTLDIIAGRGWVCIALVIFGRWRIFRGVLGALVFAAVFSLGLRLRITPGFEDVPPRTAAGAAIPGGHRRAGAVRPQRALSGRLPEGVSSVLRTRSEE